MSHLFFVPVVNLRAFFYFVQPWIDTLLFTERVKLGYNIVKNRELVTLITTSILNALHNTNKLRKELLLRIHVPRVTSGTAVVGSIHRSRLRRRTGALDYRRSARSWTPRSPRPRRPPAIVAIAMSRSLPAPMCAMRPPLTARPTRASRRVTFSRFGPSLLFGHCRGQRFLFKPIDVGGWDHTEISEQISAIPLLRCSRPSLAMPRRDTYNYLPLLLTLSAILVR